MVQGNGNGGGLRTWATSGNLCPDETPNNGYTYGHTCSVSQGHCIALDSRICTLCWMILNQQVQMHQEDLGHEECESTRLQHGN